MIYIILAFKSYTSVEPEIRKRGRVPKNGSVFFTIFQTFMSGRDAAGNPSPSFGDYPPDFFDFIVIDECHRGGANDESNPWSCGIIDSGEDDVRICTVAQESVPGRCANGTYKYGGMLPVTLRCRTSADTPTTRKVCSGSLNILKVRPSGSRLGQ